MIHWYTVVCLAVRSHYDDMCLFYFIKVKVSSNWHDSLIIWDANRILNKMNKDSDWVNHSSTAFVLSKFFIKLMRIWISQNELLMGICSVRCNNVVFNLYYLSWKLWKSIFNILLRLIIGESVVTFYLFFLGTYVTCKSLTMMMMTLKISFST